MYGCLPLFLFAVLAVFFYALTFIFRVFFGLRDTARKFSETINNGGGKQSPHRQQQDAEQKTPKKKFESDEGVYVDFEEIKE